MLLLHKGGLNHLWKALKISKGLKSWDPSDVSIPDRRAKNPKPYTVNWEDFPANPDRKHSLWLFCSCSDQFPEKRRLVWPHGVLICICPLHQPLSSSSEPFSSYSSLWQAPLKEQQYWELNWCQSWGKPPGNLPCFKNQKNTTWVNFLLDVYLVRPKKSNHEIQACWKLGSLISQLAGWEHACGRSSDKKDAALVTVLTETAWRSIRKKEFPGKIRNTRLPKTSGFSQEHAPLMTAGVDFTRLTVMTSKIYYSFYNKTMSSKEWCSDSIYLSGFSFFSFLGHINILLYFKNSHSCLLNLE